MKASGFGLVAFILLAGCHRDGSESSARQSLPAVAVRVGTAERVAHAATEDVVGTVRSQQRAIIEAKISGRLVKYLAVPGQSAKAGDLLAEVDANEIHARLDQAKAVLDQARRDLARQQQLIASKATSQQELDAAMARVHVATAAVAEAETMTSYANVTAPFDGVVTRKLADVGDLAMPGKPLVEIESPDKLRFETDLPESLLERITVGAVLPVRLPALDEPLQGKVVEISPVADPVSRTFLVKLDLPGRRGLRPGQFGRVAVPVAEIDLLLVPASALIQRGQMEIVYVVENDHAALRLVKSGKPVGDRVEILSGLQAGERVVVGDGAALHDGQPITSQP